MPHGVCGFDCQCLENMLNVDTAVLAVTTIVSVFRISFDSWGRMHDVVVSASLRLKLTYDGLAHSAGMQNSVLALVQVLPPVVA